MTVRLMDRVTIAVLLFDFNIGPGAIVIACQREYSLAGIPGGLICRDPSKL